MMATEFRKVKNMLHLFMLGFGICFYGGILGLECVYCSHFLAFAQFVDSTSAGFILMAFVLVLGVCYEEELPFQTQLAVSYMGGICYLLSVIFVGLEIGEGKSEVWIYLSIVFGIVLVGLYFFEAIYFTVKKGMDLSV